MNLKDSSILITGGTGSFGHAFTDYLIHNTDVRRIVIYSRDEYKQFLMRQTFAKHDERLRFFIGDIRDEGRLRRALNSVDYAIHAAAMKQVVACEYNPIEAIKTNIEGATNLINAALDNPSMKKVIALSTDKAVNPINLYGGTKLVSDKLFSSANSYSGLGQCTFSVVRYGNVACSRGSVVPFFREQMASGIDELPLTDVRMTRFWMTLGEAVKLVMKALTLSKRGEVFVHKNPSFYISDLIAAMNTHGRHKIVGIREGEKLHEAMITSDDSRTTYEYEDHYIIYPQYNWWNKEKHLILGGKPVDTGWSYESDKNTWWLTVEELKNRVESLH